MVPPRANPGKRAHGLAADRQPVDEVEVPHRKMRLTLYPQGNIERSADASPGQLRPGSFPSNNKLLENTAG